MAAWLERHLPDSSRMLVSPADRAQQTAAALGRKFRTVDDLAPGGSVAALLAAANWPESREPVLIVGHQPTLGAVASFLLSGEEAYWSVKKGAVWWLIQPRPDGRCRGRAAGRDRSRVRLTGPTRSCAGSGGPAAAHSAISLSSRCAVSGCAASHRLGTPKRDRLADLEHDARRRDRPPRVVEQHGEAQREQLRARVGILERRLHLVEAAAAAQHEEREARLFAGGESRHVGVLQDVGAVLVVADVRDGEADLVQQPGPGDVLRRVRGRPRRRRLGRAPVPSRRRAPRGRGRCGSGRGSARRSRRARRGRPCARAGRRGRRAAARRRPGLIRSTDSSAIAACITANPPASTGARSGFRPSSLRRLTCPAPIMRLRRRARPSGVMPPAESPLLLQDLGERERGARGARTPRATASVEVPGDGLDLGARVRLGRAKRGRGERAVGEEALRHADAADLERLQPLGLHAAADDELGRAAADVDHEPRRGRRRQHVGDAEVDQPRFLVAADDVDRKAEGGLGARQELVRVGGDAKRVGRHGPHRARVQAAQPFGEAREARERASAVRRR